MCPYLWYQVMKFSKDKKQQHYQMVTYALKHGVKPTLLKLTILRLKLCVSGLNGSSKAVIRPQKTTYHGILTTLSTA